MITTTGQPTDWQLDWAMGYAVGNDAYKGFGKQVDAGGWQLGYNYKDIETHGSRHGWGVGISKETLDGVTITPQNIATACLYDYTPHAGAGWGGAGGGNYLFWDLYYNQFGFEASGTSPKSLDVPYFNQCDSRWSSDQLGGDGPTICSQGCALTSAAMVMAYYGVDTDPQKLNNAIGRGGYNADYCIYWSAVRNACHDEANQIEYSPGTVGFDTAVLNNHLDVGHPVIVKVYCPGYGGYWGDHFVVVTGRSDATYYINDPASSIRSTLDDYPTRYGMRIFSGNPPVENTPIPLSGDLNGDGTDSYGTFDPSTAGFTFNGKTVNFGTSTDLPVMGDWDHDGKDEIGLYRPDDGGQSKFYLITRDWASLSGPAGAADKTIPFGSYPDNIPIAGDWDGDGDDDLGGYYSGTFTFYLYLLNLGSSTATSYRDVSFGDPRDIPLIGDWDNDGDDDVAVCRKNDLHDNPTYYFDLGLTGGVEYEIGPYEWGNDEDIPITGRWNAGSGDKIGVYRPSTEEFIPSDNIPPDLRYLDNGIIRVGVNLDWGGCNK